MPISYGKICEAYGMSLGCSNVAKDTPPPPYGNSHQTGDDEGSFHGTVEELYDRILDSLAERYLKERYSLCLEIRHEGKVLYRFPKIACPRLIVEQLKLTTGKL